MERGLLIARADDAADAAFYKDAPQFLGFLSAEEASIIAEHLKKKNIKHEFFGGFSDAERRYLCVLPAWAEHADYPITAVTFSFRECDVLSHRDFLGALMALQIARECVGDILIEKGRAVAFLSREIAAFVLGEIGKIGSVGVKLSEGFSEPLPSFGNRAQFQMTVSSLRLDNAVAALCNTSRNEALVLISEKKVFLSGSLAEKPSKSVSSGDKLTVRGKGVFFIGDTSCLSKKGKIILKYEKYI